MKTPLWFWEEPLYSDEQVSRLPAQGWWAIDAFLDGWL
jgi:hypothetical protein